MTDLHSHILPFMDDGAADLDAALAMLRLEKEQGIRRIALTSHFHCEEMAPEEFLDRRAASFEALKQAWGPEDPDMQLKLGSEVYYSPNIRFRDIRKLCLEGTELLLLELPVNYCPDFLEHTLLDLQAQGITPLIAHVERYSYVLNDPSILADWIENGAYIQINAGSLLRSDKRRKMVLKLLKWGLVHVISSDTHSPDRRPPQLQQAMQEVRKHLGQDTVNRLQQNAEDLFHGYLPQDVDIHHPKRVLGRWV